MLPSMGWLRRGVVVSCLAGCGVLALGLLDCAEPTQIVVKVYSDACIATAKTPALNQTGIAVGTPTDIDQRAPSATKVGCEKPQTGGVGSLTIYPSGSKDEEVAIKVVGGIYTTPDRCVAPDYAGCIAHRRVVRFVPNATQEVTVRLTAACLNLTCVAPKTCDDGRCVDETDILDDGTKKPDAASTDPKPTTDAGMPIVDAAADACFGCRGLCTPGPGGKCSVKCDSPQGCAGELCAKALPCEITCSTADKCNDISCTTDGKCTVKCGTEKGSCRKVVCNAQSCDLECNGNGACEGALLLDAGDKGTLDCNGGGSCNGATASCRGAHCELKCVQGGPPGQQSCPPHEAGTCSGPDCAKWVNPSP